MKKTYYFKKNYGEDIIEFPVMEVTGNYSGKTLCITAGLHCCEYAGIGAAEELYDLLDPHVIAGKIIIIPIADIKTFFAKKQFANLYDNKDLNRVFPGNIYGTYSEKLAYAMYKNFISKSDFYIDLHSGDLTEDMIPFIELHENEDRDLRKKTIEASKHYGIKDIVIKNSYDDINDKHQCYAAASDDGLIAFVANAGVTHDFYNSKKIHLNGLLAFVKAFFSGEDAAEAPIPRESFKFYGHPIHIRNKHKGLYYKCEWVKIDMPIFTGNVIGEIRDVFGNILERLTAPCNGKVLLLNTALQAKENSLICEIIAERPENNFV